MDPGLSDKCYRAQFSMCSLVQPADAFMSMKILNFAWSIIPERVVSRLEKQLHQDLFFEKPSKFMQERKRLLPAVREPPASDATYAPCVMRTGVVVEE
jgi:hypothetical protein